MARAKEHATRTHNSPVCRRVDMPNTTNDNVYL